MRRLGPALLVLLAIAAAPASAAGVRIMPLGDSITYGSKAPGGYRLELWTRLQRDGAAVDFVGSRQDGPASLGDRDHEGHSGWRIDELTEAVDGWLARQQPEIVLLMIGTNDVLQNHEVAGAPARLAALLDRITAKRPRLRVLVATLPPLDKPAWQAQVDAYNAALPGIVQARARAGARVQLVDVARGMTTADLADGIHPNAGGYAKLAAAWYTALRPLLTPTAPR
jgi:lysophospholipase L1-like esterase